MEVIEEFSQLKCELQRLQLGKKTPRHHDVKALAFNIFLDDIKGSLGYEEIVYFGQRWMGEFHQDNALLLKELHLNDFHVL